MARIENSDPKFSYGVHQRGIKDLISKIRYKYEFSVTNELRDLFRIYYHPDTPRLDTEKWENDMTELGQTIVNDFERLTEEYYKLTESIHK